MNQFYNSSDLINRINKRVLFADYTRQRESSKLGLKNPINVQNYNGGTNQFTAFQNVVEGAQYTTAAEQQTYINEVLALVPPSATVPQAPTGVTAVAGNAQATVSFVVPRSDGGSPITSYTVISSPGGITATGSTSSIIVTGLTNGQAYTFTVVATNSVGSSAPSAPSASVTPATVPGSPTGVSAVAGNAEATVSFTIPGSDGGSPIIDYTVKTIVDGITFSQVGLASPITFIGLTNGQPYTFTVEANNAIGSSAPSAPSNEVIPQAPLAPDSPTLAYALASANSTYIYFTPANTGGTPTNYEYTLDSGTNYTAVSPAKITSPIYIAGLANDTLYTIGIRAVNSGGESVISNEVQVTPSSPAVPAAYLEFDPNNSSSYSGSGSTVSNVGNYGPLNGTKQASVTWIDGAAGANARKVFDFNGSATYIAFGQFDFGNAITLNAWLYPRYKDSINGILANSYAGPFTPGFKFGWNDWDTDNRRMVFEAGGPSQWTVPSSEDGVVTFNEWQLLTYVFDKTNKRIFFFKNGVPVNIPNISTAADIVTSNQEFRIGSYADYSYKMNAQLGVLTTYNSVFNASQVLDYFNNTKAAFGIV